MYRYFSLRQFTLCAINNALFEVACFASEFKLESLVMPERKSIPAYVFGKKIFLVYSY
jgi:hypothetical protein